MYIPQQLEIGGTIYEVIEKENIVYENGIAYGLTDFINHEIFIDTTKGDDQFIRDTFYHELLHAIMIEAGTHLTEYGLSNKDMEHVIEYTAKMLRQTVEANPGLFTYLTIDSCEEVEEDVPNQVEPK